MAMVSVVNWQPTGELMVQADRLGPKVGGHLEPWCIHRVNQGELSQCCFQHDDSAINIVLVLYYYYLMSIYGKFIESVAYSFACVLYHIDFQAKVLQLLISLQHDMSEVRQQVNQAVSTLQDLAPDRTDNVELQLPVGVNLPLMCDDDVTAIETALADNSFRKQLVSLLLISVLLYIWFLVVTYCLIVFVTRCPHLVFHLVSVTAFQSLVAASILDWLPW